MAKKRSILAEAMMQYPTPYTDEDIDKIEAQYKTGGLLDLTRAKEALGDRAAVEQYYKETGKYALFPQLYKLSENLKGTRMSKDIDSYWPAKATVSYPNPSAFASSDDPTAVGEASGTDARIISSRYRDALGHELQHVKQNIAGASDTSQQYSDVSNPLAAAPKTVLALLDALQPVKQKLAGNFSDNARELAAALVGYESSLPVDTDLTKDPVMGIVRSNPDFTNWYLRVTGRIHK